MSKFSMLLFPTIRSNSDTEVPSLSIQSAMFFILFLVLLVLTFSSNTCALNHFYNNRALIENVRQVNRWFSIKGISERPMRTNYIGYCSLTHYHTIVSYAVGSHWSFTNPHADSHLFTCRTFSNNVLLPNALFTYFVLHPAPLSPSRYRYIR